ncbi:MAG: hypothetical protein IPK12_05270 [Gemmatimonadetes bacterium]|nr:hypothetical protein [Gemmatimonadota bacterium]
MSTKGQVTSATSHASQYRAPCAVPSAFRPRTHAAVPPKSRPRKCRYVA